MERVYLLSGIVFFTVSLTYVTCLSTMENVTQLLNGLLKNYRKELRPGFGGPPLRIETDILIRSMGPILETQMSYSMQCYLRQRWFDDRLKFKLENITEVTLSTTFLNHIWKPNTYFLNGRGSQQHNITTPNVFVRIRDDGRIYMSRRLTIRAACPMKLMNYPMDRPVCPLFIGGYGYTTSDIIYFWKFGNDASVDVHGEVTMSQFDMGSIKSRNHTQHTILGDFAVLEVFFHLERHLGFFILQTYLPCTLIVCLSWVSFWINRDAAPARVLLGMTTILSIVAISMLQRDGLPRVPYATALDVYLNACIVYNLAAMIQYASVNYCFTKKKVSQAKDPEIMLTSPHRLVIHSHQGNGQVTTTSHVRNRLQEDTCCNIFLSCLVGNLKYQVQKVTTVPAPSEGYRESKIDILSRYMFPGTFGLFHIVYWSWYLNARLKPYEIPEEFL